MLTVSGVKLRDEHQLIHEFTDFVLNHFVSPSRLKKAKINLRVIGIEDLPEDEQDEFDEAGAWMTYDGRIKGIRKFTITINSCIIRNSGTVEFRLKRFLPVLAHELVHVKQYLNHELFDYVDGVKSRFKGKLYTLPTSKIMDWAYYESPWERDAYGRTDGLYDMFYKLRK